jgi:DNA modification methylase
MTVSILIGDVRKTLATLPAESVQCIVTSPPYYGLRDYGVDGQIGLEPTPEEYVAELVAVFREARRVLRADGVLWLNLGDSYAAGGNGGGNKNDTNVGSLSAPPKKAPLGYKQKDLLGIPWRVAFALQADGWWLRSECIWAKPNPMPESVTDRPTKAHEQVFMLTKSARYFYDAAAVAEAASENKPFASSSNGGEKAAALGQRGGNLGVPAHETRNRRTVWTIASQPFSGAHFATMPPDLAEICIKAGTSERGQCPHCGAPWVRVEKKTPMVLARSERTHEKGRTRSSGTMVEPPRSETVGWKQSCACPAHDPIPQTVLDPFGGAGTTGLVADRLQRNAILCELNPAYAEIARERINGEGGLFAAAE